MAEIDITEINRKNKIPWLAKTVPLEFYKAAESYTLNNGKDPETVSLIKAFDWDITDEGFLFWSYIHQGKEEQAISLLLKETNPKLTDLYNRLNATIKKLEEIKDISSYDEGKLQGYKNCLSMIKTTLPHL